MPHFEILAHRSGSVVAARLFAGSGRGDGL